MSSRMIRDLVAWERGELSLDALSTRHQETGIDGTVALHRMFEQMSAEETAGPTAAQVKSFLAGLPERAPRRGLLSALHVSGSQKVVAILTSIFLSGGVAYAAGFTPVREGVDSLVRGVASLFDRSGSGGSKDSGHNPSDDRPGITRTPGEDTTPGDDGDHEPTGADQDPPGNDGPDHGDDGGGDDDRDEDVDDGGVRDDGGDGGDDVDDDGTDDGGDGGDDGTDDGGDGGDDGTDDGGDDGTDEDPDDDNSGEGDLDVDVDDDDPSVHLEGHLWG